MQINMFVIELEEQRLNCNLLHLHLQTYQHEISAFDDSLDLLKKHYLYHKDHHHLITITTMIMINTLINLIIVIDMKLQIILNCY